MASTPPTPPSTDPFPTGGHVLVDAVARAGTGAVFAIHGVQIDPVFQACADLGVALVDVRHESTAGFAAEAYARVTGRVGVAAVCPGPGFTNVLTSMANARVDRTPVVYVVGSTPEAVQDSNGLQVGLDHVAMAQPVAKWACRVRAPQHLARLAAQAIRIATTAPCGPVLLDVPADVLEGAQRAPWVRLRRTPDTPGLTPPGHPPAVSVAPAAPSLAAIDEALALLAAAERPAILLGHTPSAAGRAAAAAFVEHTGIPLFTDYRALGTLGFDHDRFGGTLYQLGRLPEGARPDVALAVGTQLGFDTPGLRDGGVAWGTALIHADADPGEIGRFGPPRLGLVADPDAVLIALAERAPAHTWAVPDTWPAAVRTSLAAIQDGLDTLDPTDGARLHPYAISRAVSDAVAANGAVLVGDGAVCKHWLHDALRLPAGARYLTHGRFGCMGMWAGLAIGAAVATGGPVVAVTGDGAAGFALGELEAVVRHGLAVTVVVVNNARWGASQGFQLRPGGRGRVVGTTLSDADYHGVMTAFGGRGCRVDTLDDLRAALAEAAASGAPTCINASANAVGMAPEVPLLNA